MPQTKKQLQAASRQAAYKARLEAQGLKKVHNLWAWPADHPAIRQATETLTARHTTITVKESKK
jgi:hypothetical protein